MAAASNKFSFKSITFKDVKGKTQEFPAIIGFTYEEDLFSPFVYGSLIVNDSKKNLIGTLPIQGGESLGLKVQAPDGETYEFNFIIYSIKNRVAVDRVQTYEIKLISEAALKNESSRPCGTYSGKQSRIVTRLLRDSLELDMSKVFVETTKYETKFQADGSTNTFKLINTLSLQSVSEDFVPKKNKKSTGGEIKPLEGTAGFLFYENKDGFHFRSIDSLCDPEKQKPVKSFEYAPSNTDYRENNTNKIYDFSFDTEVNLIENLRKGSYSSVLAFYNFSTGKYEEYQYSMENTFGTMKKLGSQSNLGEVQKKLSENPTKFMSVVTDHETWWDGEGPGSYEPEDGGSGENTFGDYSKYFVAQSLGRVGILGTQKLRIAVAGSPTIMVGDTVEIFLPNVTPTDERKSNTWDDENSGIYLVSHIINRYDSSSSAMTTQLSLIRDSSGRKDRSSNVK